MTRWVALGAVALTAAACSSPNSDGSVGSTTGESPLEGSAVTAASVAESAADQPAGGMQPEGFDVVTLRSTQPDGTVLEWCVWHADTSAQRARGLMAVTDLGEPIGMAFTYDQPSSGSYYMYRTPMPLSIAWFGPDGQFVGTSDMAPCTETDSGDCARHAPDAEFTLAVEVPEGELAMRGLTARSTAQVVESPCP